MAKVIPFLRLPADAPEPEDFACEDLEFVGEARQRAIELPSELLDEQVELHSFAEHKAALDGPAFDPVHLLLRSQLQGDTEVDESALAAIVKARHDLLFWSPMVELGLGGVFSGHLGDLHEDLDLLERFAPPKGSLHTEWEDARAAIIGAIPARRARAA